MKKLLVISRDKNDFESALQHVQIRYEAIRPEEIMYQSLNNYSAIAIIGGTQDRPFVLEPDARNRIEEALQQGIRVFAEYVVSIGDVYFDQPVSTRYERLVYVGENNLIKNLRVGTILDDQCGTRIIPHDISLSKNVPILQFIQTNAHDHIEVSEEIKCSDVGKALWFEHQGDLLICAFRLSNFKKARYAPWPEFKKVVEFILGWLTEQDISLKTFEASYHLGPKENDASLSDKVTNSIQGAMNWLEDADIVRESGKKGVIEGLATEIYSDGAQKRHQMLRADCIGEVSLAYFFEYVRTGNQQHLEVSENLNDYLFLNYINQEDSHLYGMMRWTNEAWGVCYQDDVARAVIPQLFKCLFGVSDKYLKETEEVLTFLVKTTGTDGTRVFRTDNVHLTKDAIFELQGRPGNLPSAHYNGYYYAALLLAHELTGNSTFKEVAIKGLTEIMTIYPNTTREQSETQEYCRLIFPLSCLYSVTDDPTHKEWLYRVTKDLEKLQHSSGGYLEWDTGYKATMRHAMGEGESSLLVENGDPIMDLLYSNNWLPMAFMHAYYVTKDPIFKKKWQEISSFFIQTQIYSDNKDIHGGWARAYDAEKHEVFGSPADVGWGPWTIESGWTVAEITAGLSYGLLEDHMESLFPDNVRAFSEHISRK